MKKNIHVPQPVILPSIDPLSEKNRKLFEVEIFFDKNKWYAKIGKLFEKTGCVSLRGHSSKTEF